MRFLQVIYNNTRKGMYYLRMINNLVEKKIYWPICRLYARRLNDKPADCIYEFLCSLAFIQLHHYWPNFRSPVTFSEKLFVRMMHDKRSILTNITDKILVREYVADKIGEQYLIPIFWTGSNPERIPLDSIPTPFVIKTNHGCGNIILVKDKNLLDINKLNKQLHKWLKINYCLDNYFGIEWAYKNIIPKILIEKYIEEEGKPPRDYKFFCFSGRVEYVQVSFDRFGNPSERILDRDFNPLDVYNGVELYDGKIEPPVGFSKMIEIAETLSREFDFIRVDLYNVKGKIYFGELTCYPAGGLAPFVPRKWDYIFGEKWKMSRIEK